MSDEEEDTLDSTGPAIEVTCLRSQFGSHVVHDDLDITVENFTLTIRGEKKAEQTVKDDQFHRVERSYGTFTRSFALPHTVDPNRVEAEYKNGVLSIKLPLREEAKPKQIKVNVAA